MDILVTAEKRMYCDDYGERQGCGQEIKIIRNVKGKAIAVEPVQIPCYSKTGEVAWVWVPHWVCCPNNKEFSINFQRDKAREQEEWKARNGNDDRNGAVARGF